MTECVVRYEKKHGTVQERHYGTVRSGTVRSGPKKECRKVRKRFWCEKEYCTLLPGTWYLAYILYQEKEHGAV